MPAKLIKLASEIVSAFVLNNNVHASEVSGLIHSVYTAVAMQNEPPIEVEPQNAMPTHYKINKSIRKDGLVSFIDSKSYKTLGRNITAQGMSIEEYIRTFGLPRRIL